MKHMLGQSRRGWGHCPDTYILMHWKVFIHGAVCTHQDYIALSSEGG